MKTIQEEEEEYFKNFPFDEQAVRDFLGCKAELGYFKTVDVKNAKLIDMLSHPNSRRGFRILNVTVGPGTHEAIKVVGIPILDQIYEVNENEVYITYNTTQTLSGGKFTEVMKRENGLNKMIKGYTHSRS